MEWGGGGEAGTGQRSAVEELLEELGSLEEFQEVGGCGLPFSKLGDFSSAVASGPGTIDRWDFAREV